MYTLLTHHTTFLAVIAALALLNTIILWAIAGIGRSYPSADGVIDNDTLTVSRNGFVCQLDCPCHSHQDFPGMRCMDCYGQPCDEGPRQ